MTWKFCCIVCFDLLFILIYSESGSLKCVFFFSDLFITPSKNRHGTYLLNILKQTTQNSVQEEMKYISPILISLLIFAFPQNSYFHIIFTTLILAQIRGIICWGKRDPNEPILMIIHQRLSNMKGNMSLKTKYTYVNQNMQNLHNKYCESVVYVIKHTVRAMTTTVKLAAFVEIYFLGCIFQAYRGEYIFVDKQCS